MLSKVPAKLFRCKKGPVLAILQTQGETFHVVEVTCKGGPRFALGIKQQVGYYWVIGPKATKPELWKQMKETWDITVAD